MFITDLDGTLFRSDHRFSDKDLEMLSTLGEMGVIRVLATGRSLFSLQRSVTFSLPVDYLIVSTGLGIMPYPNGQHHMMRTDGLNSEETAEIAALFMDLSLDFMIHQPLPDNHVFAYRCPSSNNPDFFTRIGFYENHCRVLDGNPGSFGAASQFISMIPGPSGPEIYHLLRDKLKEFNVIKTTSPFDGKTMWLEVFPKNVSKGNAALWLAEKLQVEQANIVAVGNDYNDEDLLEKAGKAYIVANGPEDLKRRFTVVASNNSEGVSEAARSAFDM